MAHIRKGAWAMAGLMSFGIIAATTTARSGPTCGKAKQAVQRAQVKLSNATRDKNTRAATLHQCVGSPRGKRAGCKREQAAFARAAALYADAKLALDFARSQRDAACR
jgi:hypothetical protein